MAWEFTIFSALILASASVALLVCIAALRRRPDPMAWPLALMMQTAVAWAIPHAISLGFSNIEQVAFWSQMRYPGTVLAPIAYLIVALKYAGHERWLSRRVYGVLLVIPALTLVLVWTNTYHGLFWKSLSLAQVGDASVLMPEFGPWYWLNLGYLYFVTITSLVVLGSMVIRSGPIYRKQAILMYIGGFVPLATNVIINFGFGSEPMVDFTTTALAVSGVTFALALFHFDLLEIRPVARDLLIEELDDGVVVVGPNGRIRDYNHTATQILNDMEMDDPADDILPSDIVPDGGELVAEIDGQERLYRTRSTTLTDMRDRETGQIVYLNDVTDIVAREQRISVLNRILRHNIRNELNVVSGRLEMLEERVSSDNREHVETAYQCTQRVIEFAEKARNIERTLQATDTSTEIPTRAVVEQAVDNAQEKFSSASVEFNPACSEISARVADEELFEMAVIELIDNAVAHADREPQVTVDVEADDDQVHVSVADNCPRIPGPEKDILNSRMETNLEHSQGLGLWLVKWAVSLSSGTLSFEENEPHGNIVTLSLPSVDE